MTENVSSGYQKNVSSGGFMENTVARVIHSTKGLTKKMFIYFNIIIALLVMVFCTNTFVLYKVYKIMENNSSIVPASMLL